MTDNQPPTSDLTDRPTGPIPTIAIPFDGATPKAPLSRPLLAVIGVLVLALGVMTALWVTTNNQLSALQESAAAAEVTESQVPDVKSVADKHFAGVASVYGDSNSVSIAVTSYNVVKAGPALRGMLDELGFSSAVLDRMNNTRALDGTLEAQGHNCNVTWTYHPDDGLQLVFEALHPN